MFDITSSKLLILGIVALLVIGPKDLPALLRTIGKYMGIIKRHAADFRAQFDEAMRESELDQLKKDVEKMGSEAEATMRQAEQSVDKQFSEARQDVDSVMGGEPKPAGEPAAHDTGSLAATGDTASAAPSASPAQPALNGSAHASEGTAAQPESKPHAETAAAEPAGAAAKPGV
jgi:sec-independent protein translocase protein TatB